MERRDSRENPKIKALCRLLRDRGARREAGLFVCEGAVMLEEARRSGAQIESVFCTEEQAAHVDGSLAGRTYVVGRGAAEKISAVSTPQGIAFTCRIPEPPALRGSRLIALEDVRDPGNVGTVLRTAEALGLDGVVLLGDCADMYSPKTVRASMGSVFRLPVFFETAESLSGYLRENGIPFCAAMLDSSSEPVTALDLRRACVLVGNEAAGVRRETADMCDRRVLIPISGAESLNAAVAAALFMWEMVR